VRSRRRPTRHARSHGSGDALDRLLEAEKAFAARLREADEEAARWVVAAQAEAEAIRKHSEAESAEAVARLDREFEAELAAVRAALEAQVREATARHERRWSERGAAWVERVARAVAGLASAEGEEPA
jgi:hemerythrin-like domain-containing protein